MTKTMEFVVVSGWVLLLVVCFSLVGIVGVLALRQTPIDPALKDLSVAAFGFLFGSVPVMVKDLLNRQPTPGATP